ncbi:MAG: hypothetical protein ACYTCU_10750 [Planctomycetota bacterium]|jgi:hypothetical protein
MAGNWRDVSGSALLLIALLAAIALGLALLGGTVFIPLGGAALWVALGLLVFIGAQFLLFRAMGMRSKADEESDEHGSDEPEDEDTEADWRAWRG